MKQTFYKWKVEAEVTIPLYGVGTSYKFGKRRGKASFEIVSMTKEKAIIEAKKALWAQNIPKHYIHKIEVTLDVSSAHDVEVLDENVSRQSSGGASTL